MSTIPARYIHSKAKAKRQRDNWRKRALAAEAKLKDWEASVARLKAEGERMRGEEA